jgi:hypothetical protein
MCAQSPITDQEVTPQSEAHAKEAAVTKADREDLMYSLFGGPPRNRHERRKWAKIQRKKGHHK